jgi:drug/metabolite transporter (DMT)-like permease
MKWIAFVLIGQLLNTVVVLLDRYIVSSKKVASPAVYTFYVSLCSIFVVAMLPFGAITIPSVTTMWLSLAAAASYIISIYFLFTSLRSSPPFDVVPVVGGVAALSTFFFSFLFLDQGLPSHFFPGFIILTLGMLLISHFNFSWSSFFALAISGLTFGLSTTLVKLLFLHDTFANGFFWSRMGNVVGALAMIIVIPHLLSHLHSDEDRSPRTGKYLVILNKIIAGLAFFCILLAIKSGDVALVSALSATQYIFLFLFAFFFSSMFPEYLDRSIHKHELLRKITATSLIVIGFFVLFV